MKNVSGSRLPILKECGWWARDDVSYAEPVSGAAASRGTAIHQAIEQNSLEGVEFDDLTSVERGRAYVREMRAAGWDVELEVAFALDVASGRCRRLPKGEHRDYSDAAANEIPFTVDYIASMFNLAEVGDWKTGYGAHVTPTRENWQLGAAVLAMGQEPEMVRARIHYLDTGYVDAYDFNVDERDALFMRIRSAVARIPGSSPQPGDHCRYCPGRMGCPAVQGAIVAIAPELQVKVKWSLVQESVENDAMMAMHLPALKAAVEAIEKALKERSKAGLALPNGKVWRPVLQSRTGLDTERVKALLGPRVAEFTKTTEFEAWRMVKS